MIFLIRLFSDKQLDDVSPGIPCTPDLFEKADVFYVIPIFNGSSIGDNTGWCSNISGMNKELALHGVFHDYREFFSPRDDAYLLEGINTFEDCFGKSPERFKAPQLAISDENKRIVGKRMKIDSYLNSVFHKVYHCGDSGVFSNSFIDWF